MRTQIYLLKKLFVPAIVLGLSAIFQGTASGQTGSCTVIQNACNGDGILETTVTAGMTAPLTFQYWDAFHTTHTVNAYTDTFTGEWTPYVLVTDGFQHYLWLNSNMVRPFDPDYPTLTPAVCPNPGSAQFTVNNGTAPDYVEWYDDSTPFPGNYLGTGNPMSLPAGIFTAKIFYNGCYVYEDTTVWIGNISPVNFNLTTTPASCTNGTATVSNFNGGTPPYSVLWWNGATSNTVTGLSQGIYTVRVTDNIGCYRDQDFYIYQVPQIPVNLVVTQQPTCLQNDGKVMAFGSGGVNPYTYLWNNGQTAQEAINLTGGVTVSVIVTDVNGCFGEGSTYLGSSTPIVVTYTVTASSCTAPTGSATVSVTGGTPPYTVSWNTYPPQSGLTANNLAPGTYGFNVTDAAGCVQSGSIPVPPQSVINASIYSSDALCPANTGTAGISCSGVSPFSYLWNTGATTPVITGLAPGAYFCTVTDANSCTITKYTSVQSATLIQVGISSTPATCMYATDGSLLAIPTGGTPPYSYQWTNGSTLNPATNLAPGNYYVTVTDATGCHKTAFCVVGNSGTSDACYCRIDGHVYLDPLQTCMYNTGMTGIEHIQIKLEPFGYTWTDANGYFSFLVPSGNYTLSEVVQYIYPMTPSCPANDPVPYVVTASSGCQYSHDFFNLINPLNDVHFVPVNWIPPVPGFGFSQRLYIQNDGTTAQSDILLNYYPDPNIGPFASVPSMTSGGTFFFNSGSIALNPGDETEYFVNYMNPIPVNMPLGTILNFQGIVAYEPPISNWMEDYTPWNNWINWTATVVGSYDPNSKEVFPKGDGEEGIISVKDSVLDYVIHFQNVGTWYAENVVITDTLSPDLDWTTLRPGASSHPYTAELSESGVLKFTFRNIHLVWESENEINSNGMVTYSVKQRPGLDIGTKIRNSAAIFFDFNAPVITDTTLNTIGIHEGIGNITPANRLKLYPNPVTSQLSVDPGESGSLTSLTICTLAGSTVLEFMPTAERIQKVPVQGLASGMYFITAVTARGERFTGKFIKD
jgi:hypothetical protein